MQKRSRDTHRAPFGWNYFTLWVEVAVVHPLEKFRQCNFIRSRNIEGGFKFLKGTHDPDHAPVWKFFTPAVGLAVLDPFAQFEERTFIRTRNIKTV